MHPRNKHTGQYNFETLTKSHANLKQYVALNTHGKYSIDFANPKAVKALNTALLKNQYKLDYWDIPTGYLCPPIPGRADYIHHLADLLAHKNHGKIPRGAKIHCLDIGVGANCIYPIVGQQEYGWFFVGSDIEATSIQNAQRILEANSSLQEGISLHLQTQAKHIFKGIFQDNLRFDLTLCNPPFHTSAAEAHKGSLRKVKNLTSNKKTTVSLNFAGQSNELWCEGGEKQFLKKMIKESKSFATSCFWFTSLVSKQSNLKTLYHELQKAQAVEIKTIDMGQGNKQSRFIAWTFLSKEQQEYWAKARWS